MITIQQKRVLNIAGYLPQEFQEQDIVIGVLENQITSDQVKRMGLSWPLVTGEVILPSIVGPITRFNTLGKEIPQRNQPKETHYRDMEFTRHQWRGKDQTEVVTSFVWIPYLKYPREIILPPGLEILVSQSQDGHISLLVKTFKFTVNQFEEIKHAINIFLELFGVCNIYLPDQDIQKISVTKRLNWKLLPPGNLPWEVLKKVIVDNQSRQPPKTFLAALNRFEKISALDPDFRAIGQGGYQGYVIFGFTAKNIFILESQRVNNAIYILGDNWEDLSRLTKAEILAGKKHIARIIHAPNWYKELLKYI
ncbi:hypothetical protein CAP31_09770 [Sulfuriferula sp. AH1]|uniref:hypothetical protein n=1 Tax=Sulfuriferula sp. AH1 TaxID=1985873 RepID=UPI000B3B6074|nr:hypothetical protein [Sulfuriferula sp. AH1]ARU31939.1 hypothetical protein CAP31_09770 [Sulfuriferula sp. AH1]